MAPCACPQPIAGRKDNRQNRFGQLTKVKPSRPRLVGVDEGRPAPWSGTAPDSGRQARDDLGRRGPGSRSPIGGRWSRPAGRSGRGSRRTGHGGPPAPRTGDGSRSRSGRSARGRSPSSRIPATRVSAYFPSPGLAGVNETPSNSTPGSAAAPHGGQHGGRVEPGRSDLLERRVRSAAHREVGALEQAGPRVVVQAFEGPKVRARRDERQAGPVEWHRPVPARGRHDGEIHLQTRGRSCARRASSPSVMPCRIGISSCPTVVTNPGWSTFPCTCPPIGFGPIEHDHRDAAAPRRPS